MEPALTTAPDSRKRLSEGALVEASVRARLLGIPLLKLEASIVLAPAEFTAPRFARSEAPARQTVPPSRVSPRGSDAAGRGLAEAVRSIDEAARTLADVRRNGA
jgi:hypothetical protein